MHSIFLLMHSDHIAAGESNWLLSSCITFLVRAARLLDHSMITRSYAASLFSNSVSIYTRLFVKRTRYIGSGSGEGKQIQVSYDDVTLGAPVENRTRVVSTIPSAIGTVGL